MLLPAIGDLFSATSGAGWRRDKQRLQGARPGVEIPLFGCSHGIRVIESGLICYGPSTGSGRTDLERGLIVQISVAQARFRRNLNGPRLAGLPRWSRNPAAYGARWSRAALIESMHIDPLRVPVRESLILRRRRNPSGGSRRRSPCRLVGRAERTSTGTHACREMSLAGCRPGGL